MAGEASFDRDRKKEMMLLRRQLACALLLLALCAQAQTRLDALKQHAERQNEQSRGPIYIDIGRELVELANHQFENGEADKAQSNVKEAVSYAEKAVDSARQRGKKIKETEINLRKMSNRVEELRHSVAADEQPPLQEARSKLEQLRIQLLDHMFRKEK
jgi:tetratricopeptide (TPR) repeat protein